MTQRALVLAAALLAASLLAPAGAAAHALLVNTVPQRGATLRHEPRQVVLHFSETVEGNFGALRVFDALRDRPLANLNALTESTGASYPTVARAVEALENLGIVHEITGRKRERVFAYTSYLAILNEGTQPLQKCP